MDVYIFSGNVSPCRRVAGYLPTIKKRKERGFRGEFREISTGSTNHVDASCPRLTRFFYFGIMLTIWDETLLIWFTRSLLPSLSQKQYFVTWINLVNDLIFKHVDRLFCSFLFLWTMKIFIKLMGIYSLQ